MLYNLLFIEKLKEDLINIMLFEKLLISWIFIFILMYGYGKLMFLFIFKIVGIYLFLL